MTKTATSTTAAREHFLQSRPFESFGDHAAEPDANQASGKKLQCRVERQLSTGRHIRCDATDADQEDHQQRCSDRSMNLHAAEQDQCRHDDEAAADSEHPRQKPGQQTHQHQQSGTL